MSSSDIVKLIEDFHGTASSSSIDNITEYIKVNLESGTTIVMGENNALIIKRKQDKISKEDIIKFMSYEDVADSFIIEKVRYIITKTYTYEDAIKLRDRINTISIPVNHIYIFLIQHEESDEIVVPYYYRPFGYEHS